MKASQHPEAAFLAAMTASATHEVRNVLAIIKESAGLVAHLEGEWWEGWVAGELQDRGWSAAMSYPALRWCPEGGKVTAHLLVSSELPEHWHRLDEFEGLEYSRILAPFWTADGQLWVGNVYAVECEMER